MPRWCTSGSSPHDARYAELAVGSGPINTTSKDQPQFWNVCVEHQPAHAGLYRGIQDFARALGGHVLSFDADEGLSGVTAPGHAAVHRIQAGRSWLARRVLRIDEAAAHEAESVVENAALLVTHSLFRAHAPWAHDWALRHRRPYWVVPHGCLDPKGLARRTAAKRLWLWRHGGRLFADARVVVFATQREHDKAAHWIAREASAAVSRERARGVVVPWPVALPSLEGVSGARAMFRQHYGIPESAPILLFVGRLQALKRPRQTIEAFASACVAHCHLVVVGMDEDVTRAALQADVAQQVAGRVHVVGALHGEDLAEAWLAADGYISLSAKENFGYAAADALAHGLPVILSPGHDLAYELPGADRGWLESGWLLPDDSLQAAVQAIREWSELVTSPGAPPRRLASFRESGRAWVEENLSFERFQASLQNLAAASS